VIQQFPSQPPELEEGGIPDSPVQDLESSDTKRHKRNAIPVADTTKYRSREIEDNRRNPRNPRKFVIIENIYF
jgi:hypothetical protein